jgi:hypothetical protein
MREHMGTCGKHARASLLRAGGPELATEPLDKAFDLAGNQSNSTDIESWPGAAKRPDDAIVRG